MTYVKGDIESIDQFNNPNYYCFHLAAQSRVQPSFEDPEESLRVNVQGTLKVMNGKNNERFCMQALLPNIMILQTHLMQ